MDWCDKWGGALFRIDEESEYGMIEDTVAIYWYGQNNGTYKLPVSEGENSCLEFNPAAKRLWKSDSCHIMHQFICKREKEARNIKKIKTKKVKKLEQTVSPN